MADERKLEFLWQLFCLHLAGAPDKSLDEHINSMYDLALDLGDSFEVQVDKFVLSHDRALLDMAIIEAVRQRCFDTTRHVQLLAVAVEREWISQEAGAALLDMRGSKIEELPKVVGNAIDVAWLINEDRRDGVMGVEADHQLKDALANVSADFLASLAE